MRRAFFLTLGLFFLIWGFSAYTKESSKNAQIELIERQIQELKEIKRGYESRARRHIDQAERLQFENQAMLETRRHLELADENKAKAKRAQEEIDRLEAAKQKLIGIH